MSNIPTDLLDQLVATADQHGYRASRSEWLSQAAPSSLTFDLYPEAELEQVDVDAVDDFADLLATELSVDDVGLAQYPVGRVARFIAEAGDMVPLDALYMAVALRVLTCFEVMDDAGLDLQTIDEDQAAAWIVAHVGFQPGYARRVASQVVALAELANDERAAV